MLNDDNGDQIFFFALTCPDGIHISEEQNQNHEMSTGYKPATSHMHQDLLAIEKNMIPS
jgi:hypothetical protein